MFYPSRYVQLAACALPTITPAFVTPTIVSVDSGSPWDASNPGGMSGTGTDLTNPTTATIVGGYKSATYNFTITYDTPTDWGLNELQPCVSSGDYDLSLTTAAGTSTPFTVHCNGSQDSAIPPTLNAVTPMSVVTGPAAGGTDIELTGMDFTQDMGVSFDGGTVYLPLNSYTNQVRVNITTPAHAAGAIFIKIRNNDGIDTSLVAFTFT